MEWYLLTRARGKFLDPWAVRLEILNNGILIIRLAARLIASDETFLPNPDNQISMICGDTQNRQIFLRNSAGSWENRKDALEWPVLEGGACSMISGRCCADSNFGRLNLRVVNVALCSRVNGLKLEPSWEELTNQICD
jgi:hypothetical protein